MATTRQHGWFGSETDPASNPPTALATTASSGSAPTNGPQLRWRSRAFNKDTDQSILLYFSLPSSYYSGGALIFKYLTTVTSGAVVWKWALVIVHPASEGSPTDLDAAVLGSVTAVTANTVPATAGQTKEMSIDLALSGAHGGDLLVVMLGRDADNAADTASADVLLTEPWYLTFTTI